jgi:hypothetical protein
VPLRVFRRGSKLDHNSRVRQARIAAGFKSSRPAVMRFGWPPSTERFHRLAVRTGKRRCVSMRPSSTAKPLKFRQSGFGTASLRRRASTRCWRANRQRSGRSPVMPRLGCGPFLHLRKSRNAHCGRLLNCPFAYLGLGHRGTSQRAHAGYRRNRQGPYKCWQGRVVRHAQPCRAPHRRHACIPAPSLGTFPGLTFSRHPLVATPGSIGVSLRKCGPCPQHGDRYFRRSSAAPQAGVGKCAGDNARPIVSGESASAMRQTKQRS